MNALKTGIDAKSAVIPGEDPAELEKLTEEYYESNAPVTAQERQLIDTLITCDWRLRRYRKVEAELWIKRYKEDEPQPLSYVFSITDTLTRLQRHLDSTDCTYHRALRDLERLQSQCQKAAPQPVSTTNDEPNPEIGFVPPPAPPTDHLPLFGHNQIRYSELYARQKPSPQP